jgi:nascent polypeptide-associated complex subunit alpha
MLPGLGGINPGQMKSMMKQLGIKSSELNAKKVIIELEGSQLVFENPAVTEVDMKGQKTYTITGNPTEERVAAELKILQEDIEMVKQQARVSEEEARSALEKSEGDLAEAISSLKKEE